MPPWTVALLCCLFALAKSMAFDCNDPAADYICKGGRYYKVLDNVLWQEAHDKCIGEGTQLAIAYSAQDIDTMNELLGLVGKHLEFFCKVNFYISFTSSRNMFHSIQMRMNK